MTIKDYLDYSSALWERVAGILPEMDRKSKNENNYKFRMEAASV